MDRQCGLCTACCTLTRVPEFDKPHGVACRHCDHGCNIYSERPQSCRDFECAWLRGELPGWMRPDLVHVMIERLSDHLVIALPEAGYEHDWCTVEVLQQLQNNYQQRGTAVVIPGRRALVPTGHSIDTVFAALDKIAELFGVSVR